MGGGSTTTSQTTGSASPAVTSTLNKLLGSSGGGGWFGTGSTAPDPKSLQGVFDAGPNVFNKSLYAGVGPTTTAAQQATLDAAGNPAYTSGINGAINDYADIAAGNRFGTNDPGYAALRDKLSNDVLTQTNAAFNNSGLFGSDANQEAASEGLGNALANLDYTNFQNDQQRQQQAIETLPGLFQSLLAPSAAQGAVGAAQDVDAQNKLNAEADLFDRTKNANLNFLGQIIPLLTGAAPTGGTTTTSTQPSTPWWQSALGLGLSFL